MHPLYAAIRLILSLCFLVGVAVRMIRAGYRGLGADYLSGGFNYDVTAYETTIGAEFRFLLLKAAGLGDLNNLACLL